MVEWRKLPKHALLDLPEMKVLKFGLLALACCIAPTAWADAQNSLPQVELRLVQKYTVPNSELIAQLRATAEQPQASSAASVVNEDLRWAERQLAAYPQIHWQLAGYSSSRQSDKDWQVAGDLSLRADPQVLLPVLATLQSRLQLHSLQSEAAASTIATAQRQASTAVLHRFVEDARNACTALGLSWSGVERVSIQSAVPVQPIAPVFLAAERAVPAPVEMGHSESHGQIDLTGTAFCKK